MKTLSLDLRERILASYDAGKGTRQDIADRYDVSLGMVKKLLSQRKRTGDIASRYQRADPQAQRHHAGGASGDAGPELFPAGHSLCSAGYEPEL